jgi:hypothetical protein
MRSEGIVVINTVIACKTISQIWYQKWPVRVCVGYPLKRELSFQYTALPVDGTRHNHRCESLRWDGAYCS